jgi:hypothetical protein
MCEYARSTREEKSDKRLLHDIIHLLQLDNIFMIAGVRVSGG